MPIFTHQVKLTKRQQTLLQKIEDKSIREFKQNSLTETIRKINLNSHIVSHMTPKNKLYEEYNAKLNEYKDQLKRLETYLERDAIGVQVQ